VNTCLQFTFPLLLNAILKFLEEYQAGIILDSDPWYDRYRGYWLSGVLFFAMVCKAVSENFYFHIVNRGAWQTKAAISVSVYNKSLRLSNVERQSTTLGELVNLMQVDASKVELFIPQIHVLWDGVFQILGYMGILYTLIGPSCFAGLLVMLLAGPVQIIVMKKLFGLNHKMVKYTDARVESVNEALQGIQGVKMYTWEDNVSKKVESFRLTELKYLKTSAYLKGFSRAYMGALPGIVAVVSFAVYALTDSAEITASRLFAAIVAFDQLRFPLLFYPLALAQLVQAQVSAARLEIFLSMGEIVEGGATGKGTYSRENGSGGGITLRDAEIFWSDPAIPLDSTKQKVDKLDETSSSASTTEKSIGGSSDHSDDGSTSTDRHNNGTHLDDAENPEPVLRYPKAVLKNFNVDIKSGEICAVVGRVGSGKSTLCCAVLNETFLNKGSITLKGEVAYAAQAPWILNATLRENILFGLPLDEDRYNRVIRACQLEHDLTLLEDGDLTDIGEKGINLSGGQKARVSVARAAYSNADTVILDDPLSALDPEVGAALFNDCIAGDLMAGKTRLLVTNQLQFIGSCDHIIVLKQGEILEDGTAAELLAKQDSEVNRLLAKLSHKSSKKDGKEKKPKTKKHAVIADLKNSIAVSKNTKLLTKEERNVGAVELSVYLKYIKAGGGYVLFFFVYLGYIFTAATQAGSMSWISYWTTDGTYEFHPRAFYLGIYAALAITLGLFTFIRSYMLAFFGIEASEKLHKNLLSSILRAPQSFFDTTPLGRIISRFSKDVYSVDLELGDSIEFVLYCTLTVAISLLSIVVITPWFGVAIVPIGIIYYKYLQYYRAVSRETKRLDSISRSPVFAQFSEVSHIVVDKFTITRLRRILL
jgi:ATP-binding cassette subfamily C (CFTR/MRP) protein 1